MSDPFPRYAGDGYPEPPADDEATAPDADNGDDGDADETQRPKPRRQSNAKTEG